MQLGAWLKRQNIAAVDFAERVGVGPWSITRYVNGDRVPRPKVMARIIAATGGEVTANDFVIAPDAAVEQPPAAGAELHS